MNACGVCRAAAAGVVAGGAGGARGVAGARAHRGRAPAARAAGPRARAAGGRAQAQAGQRARAPQAARPARARGQRTALSIVARLSSTNSSDTSLSPYIMKFN